MRWIIPMLCFFGGAMFGMLTMALMAGCQDSGGTDATNKISTLEEEKGKTLTILIPGSLGVLIWLTGKDTIGIIVGADSAEAIRYGMIRLTYVTLFVCIYSVNTFIAHGLQAFGYPIFSSISNIAFTLGFRVIWMQFIFPLEPTFDSIMQCFPVSWFLNTVTYSICFAFIFTRYIKKNIYRKIK